MEEGTRGSCKADRDDEATATQNTDDHTKMFLDICERKGAADMWMIGKIKEGHCKTRVPRRHLEGRR